MLKIDENEFFDFFFSGRFFSPIFHHLVCFG